MNNRKRTTISLNHEVYSRLERYGKFGESFDHLIKRILDELDGARRK
jgi:hypothetical protein